MIYTYKINKHWYLALYVIFLKAGVFHGNLRFFEELIWVYVKNLICSPACMQQSAVSVMLASWEVVCCWVPHPVLSVISGLSNTTTLQLRITTTTVVRRSCRAHKNCMHSEQIIIIFYIIFFFSMYLVLFSIVLHRKQ